MSGYSGSGRSTTSDRYGRASGPVPVQQVDLPQGVRVSRVFSAEGDLLEVDVEGGGVVTCLVGQGLTGGGEIDFAVSVDGEVWHSVYLRRTVDGARFSGDDMAVAAASGQAFQIETVGMRKARVLYTQEGTGSAEVTLFAAQVAGNAVFPFVYDGFDVSQGGMADVEATGDGSVIAILKRIRTLLGSVVALVTRSSSATLSNVAGTATSTTLLAANTSRLGATIYNDSSARLYVKLGSTASTTSFTVALDQDDYYEVPAGYTGRIDGIWASDSSGAARITELT